MNQFARFFSIRSAERFLVGEALRIEIIPPAQHGPKLLFQVFCNGMPIGQARLEKIAAQTIPGNRLLQMLDASRGPVYHLKMIEISQNYRQRGIGTALLQEILHYCAQHNVRRLNGEIKGDLPALRRWYAQNGFTVLGNDWLEFRLA